VLRRPVRVSYDRVHSAGFYNDASWFVRLLYWNCYSHDSAASDLGVRLCVRIS